MQYLRSKLYDVLFVLWTAIVGVTLPFLWMFRAPSRTVRMVSHLWVRGMRLGLRTIVGLDYVERGRENIPAEPCIIVANHQSPWETYIFTLLFPDASIVTKYEAGQIPVVGWFLKRYPMILIDRGSGPSAFRKMIEEGRKTIAEGRSVIVFPEGTRKSVHDRIAFKRGFEFLYSELGRPVLPVAVNSGAFWGPDRWFRYAGTITVSYLPVVEPGLSRNEFHRRSEAVIQAEKDRLLAELGADEWIEALG
jgi:1-acyl-sn-glycerol-3-phosphate acyltransferase